VAGHEPQNRPAGLFFLAPLPALGGAAGDRRRHPCDKPYGEGKIRFLFSTLNAKLWTDASTWSMDAPCAMEIQYAWLRHGRPGGTYDQGNEDCRPAAQRNQLAKWTPELNKVIRR